MIKLNADTDKMQYSDGHQAPIVSSNLHSEKQLLIVGKDILFK
jgi:hypothetical protein